jgi:hypothetical protein
MAFQKVQLQDGQ